MNQRTTLRAAVALLALTMTLSPAAGAISVEEARDLLRSNYIDEVPDEILSQPTVEAITNALGDPYTYYMTPEQYADFQKDMGDTDTVGIGVMVEKLSDGLRVSSIAPDAPAAEAGLQIGDVIVAADGVTIQEAGSADALAVLIGGKEGTEVTVTLHRGKETLDVAMTRAAVVFPTVTGRIEDGHIGWLDCTTFGENSGAYFEEYITGEDEQADHWVVDLRSNPGGSAVAVIEAVGHVLGNHDVAYLVDRQGSLGVWRPSPFPVEIPGLIQEPLVVLVDGNSASASELFAAAMRDYHYGLIIGARTFGKGVAQNIFEQEDGSAFKITTNRYYSPNYVTPDRSGVLPHLVVDPNLADEAARLLCGGAAEKPSGDVLVLHLAGQVWYVHKDAATSEELAPAFAELLAALPPNTPMTLDGKAVAPAAVSSAWKAEYTSRWFGDVSASPYADEINTLASLGVLHGDESGNFNPKGELSRAELVSLVTQAMGYWCWESQDGAPFTDVTAADWYSTAVDITYNLGLIRGNDKGEFDPAALIDHQQFLTILARMGDRADLSVAQRLENVTEEELSAPSLQAYDAWARPAAVTAESLGLLSVPLEELSPSAVTTREEAAAMIYNFLAYTGILTPVTAE